MTPPLDLMFDVILDSYTHGRNPVVYSASYVDKALTGSEEELTRIIKAAETNTKLLLEHAYLMSDGGLVYVSSGIMGIDGVLVYKYSKICPNCSGLFHTHPIPLPIPTPIDALNAYNRGSSIECIGSMIEGEPIILCIKPKESWKTIASAIAEFSSIIEEYTDAYAPVDVGEGVFMAPYPSESRAMLILDEFINAMKGYARVYVDYFTKQ